MVASDDRPLMELRRPVALYRVRFWAVCISLGHDLRFARTWLKLPASPSVAGPPATSAVLTRASCLENHV
jgi:hypothetical protein